MHALKVSVCTDSIYFLSANQETVVEILSFLKQVVPKSSKRSLQTMSDKKELSKSTADLFAFHSEEKVCMRRHCL